MTFVLADAAGLQQTLAQNVAGSQAIQVVVVKECTSTNLELMTLPWAPQDLPIRLMVAHHQTAGRGQRGRIWSDVLGHSLIFSLAFRFPSTCFPLFPKPAPSWFALMVGLKIVKVLSAMGFSGINVKWPNDIWWRGRKLAGLLVEQSADRLVLGVGMNILPLDGININEQNHSHAHQHHLKMSRASISLKEIASELQMVALPHCHVLISNVIGAWMNAFARISSTSNFSSWLQEWRQYDALIGKYLDIQIAREQMLSNVKYDGINHAGQLMIINEFQHLQTLTTAQILRVY